MNKSIATYGLLLLLPILQIVIFSNIDLFGYIDPYVYVLFVFVFPFKKNKSALLLSSFLLGLFIDILTNDGGVHAFSLVFIANIRSFVLQILSGKSSNDLIEIGKNRIAMSIQFVWIFILVLIHHFILFSLEAMSLSLMGNVLNKTVLTSLLTILFIGVFLQLFGNNRSHA